MDSIVTVQFFRASADNGDVSGFENAIMNQAAKPTPTEREIDLGRGIFFRLERCESDGDFIVGEFCRKQITNIPPQAGNLGLSKIILSDGHGLGHVSAFRYHIPTKILAFQQNRMCGSPARISLYIKS